MKILFFTNNLFGKDGWSRYSLDIITTLKSGGIDVVCLVSKKTSLDIKQYEIMRDPLKYLVNPLNILRDFKKVKDIIRSENPEIIHFLVEPYALFLVFLYGAKIKYFLTVHGSYALVPLEKFRTKFMADIYYKRINKIVVVSNYTKEKLVGRLPWLNKKIEIVNNGINFKEETKINFPKNNIKSIVFIGAVKERKGLIEAVEALNVYSNKYNNNFTFDIVGEFNEKDYYFNNLKNVIFKYNLLDKIKFLGSVNEEEKNNILKNADLFMMISKNCGNYFEGFGLAYLEANKYGVPVIGSQDSGARDAIKDSFSGYLVDPMDADMVAGRINLVLNENRIKRGDCFKWARKNNISVAVNKLIKIYQINQ